MKTYQFLVECVFVSFGQDDAEETYGFFATLTVRSASPTSASAQLAGQLRRRMTEAGVKISYDGEARTQCRIDEFWELVEDSNVDEPTKGLSLFRISRFSKVTTCAKFWWIRNFQPHMLVNLES